MTKSQKEACKVIAQYYGEGSQHNILQEELAELIQAVSKVRREIPDADRRLLDALADVSIMVEQIISYMDEDEHTEFYKIINVKLQNQLQIIKERQGG